VKLSRLLPGKKKYPGLLDVLAILPQHGHIKDQVIWGKGIYEFQAFTTLGDSGLLVNCHISLRLNVEETREWIKRGGLKE